MANRSGAGGIQVETICTCAEDTATERYLLPASGESRGDFGLSEAPFRPDGDVNRTRVVRSDLREGLAIGMCDQATRVLSNRRYPIAECLWFSNLHEAIAAALFGGFDDAANESLGRACGWLGDAPLRD